MDVGDERPTQILVDVFNQLRGSVNVGATPECLPEIDLERHLITASLPFLRCAALLFSNLTDVPAPPSLHGMCVIILLGKGNLTKSTFDFIRLRAYKITVYACCIACIKHSNTQTRIYNF